MNYFLKMVAIVLLISMVAFSGCMANTDNNNNQNIDNQVNTPNNVQTNHHNNRNVVNNNGDINTTIMHTIIASYPKQELSEKEKEGLIEMREEEKLARDVYLALYNKWKIPIFQNIANSELSHTTSIKILLDKYGIKDPVVDDTPGKFTNPKYQKLYNDLIEKGYKSVIDALIVGCTIEDLDIKDLQYWASITDNEDIKFTYANLEKGSRNHMRSFYRLLKNYGGNYTPKYISQEEFEQIINSQIERGPVNR
ncbi:Protein of unknown function DUF2202 [Methanocaldococcus infernus ME]|uniref:DUF2202 domain-containing protein n=1 Tax=Methanocaldococcus infernus (strain DSM 11812 / JCM 15783 / ME) TaxID=573063 RepID=D5VSE3_METIM|nr:DUF2202 domain-containing protein [Methanocaldococcus infernus]ADG13496.1 Protein of unknown function DUF2202 [Methanocaldococcus infernus ME]